jgi:hypothetical protein
MKGRQAKQKQTGVFMDRLTETRTGFLGTYFDRDAVLRIARLAGLLAWVLLGLYAYITLVSLGQSWLLVASGGVSYEGANMFDRLSIPSLHFSQLAPGLVYFVMLKTAQQVLLILLDMEDNSRRAARK